MRTPELGTIGQVKHHEWYSFMAYGIRLVQSRFHLVWCKAHGKHYTEPWGEHTFRVVPCPESPSGVGAGESKWAKGTIITPWEVYVDKIARGDVEVRFFRQIHMSDGDRQRSNVIWMRDCYGKSYDKPAIFKLLWKAIRGIWDDVLKDEEYEYFCSESASEPDRTMYKSGEIKIDIWQCNHPLPMTVMQLCGELQSNKIKTLEEYSTACQCSVSRLQKTYLQLVGINSCCAPC